MHTRNRVYRRCLPRDRYKPVVMVFAAVFSRATGVLYLSSFTASELYAFVGLIDDMTCFQGRLVSVGNNQPVRSFVHALGSLHATRKEYHVCGVRRGLKMERKLSSTLLAHHGGDVHGLGVRHGDGGVSVHEQHRHRDAHDVGPAEHHRPLPRYLHAVPVKEFDAALRSGEEARRLYKKFTRWRPESKGK